MGRSAQAGQARSQLTSKLGALLVGWRLNNSDEDFGASRGPWWCALYARLGNEEVRVQEHELIVLPTVFIQNAEIPVSPLSELMRQSELNLYQRIANHGADGSGYGSADPRIFLLKGRGNVKYPTSRL
jgi:hypothetical protein